MAKKFDIHEWQSKQRLAEQEDFTPDLEDDELKRSKIQQMMAKEKPTTPQEVPMGTLNKAIEDLAKMYSYGEILDALKVFYTDNDELPFAEMAKKHAKEFRDYLDNDDEEELEEINATGTGASFNAGDGEGYATPNAFAKKDKWKGKKAVYEQDEDEIDWSVATDDEIKAIGGDVYYGSEGGDDPEGGQRMLVPPEDGWPQGTDRDGDGDIDIEDIDFTDPDANLPAEKLKPPRDVDYIHNLMVQKINNRQEYGAFIRAALEMDVPQKKTSLQQSFADLPALRNQLVKHFGDEKDNTETYSWTTDKEVNAQKDKGKRKDTFIQQTLSDFAPMDYATGNIDRTSSRQINKAVDKVFKENK